MNEPLLLHQQFGTDVPLALPAPPPPVIVARGVSMVPYGQLEALNNRLNRICGERDGLQQELDSQAKEMHKVRDKNRVLFGENLLLKQQQVTRCFYRMFAILSLQRLLYRPEVLGVNETSHTWLQ